MGLSDVCRNCGKAADVHWAVNYSNGPYVSMVVLICPDKVFQVEIGDIMIEARGEPPKEPRPPQPPRPDRPEQPPPPEPRPEQPPRPERP